MKIGIIDYGAGNVQSVKFAIERLGYSAELLSDTNKLNTCDKIIFPGVGHAKPAMQRLREKNLDKFILDYKKPLLGICLGMQLLCKHSEEGDTTCIGVFDVPVKKFNSSLIGFSSESLKRSSATSTSSESVANTSAFELTDLKIPHVGWNSLFNIKTHLFDGITEENSFVYFVHSYYVPQNEFSIATCNYGIDFAASLAKDNFYGTQFHPEKSGEVGERILRKFLERK